MCLLKECNHLLHHGEAVGGLEVGVTAKDAAPEQDREGLNTLVPREFNNLGWLSHSLGLASWELCSQGARIMQKVLANVVGPENKDFAR